MRWETIDFRINLPDHRFDQNDFDTEKNKWLKTDIKIIYESLRNYLHDNWRLENFYSINNYLGDLQNTEPSMPKISKAELLSGYKLQYKKEQKMKFVFNSIYFDKDVYGQAIAVMAVAIFAGMVIGYFVSILAAIGLSIVVVGYPLLRIIIWLFNPGRKEQGEVDIPFVSYSLKLRRPKPIYHDTKTKNNKIFEVSGLDTRNINIPFTIGYVVENKQIIERLFPGMKILEPAEREQAAKFMISFLTGESDYLVSGDELISKEEIEETAPSIFSISSYEKMYNHLLGGFPKETHYERLKWILTNGTNHRILLDPSGDELEIVNPTQN